MKPRTVAAEMLKKFPKGRGRIYHAPRLQGARIRAAARTEGLGKPGN